MRKCLNCGAELSDVASFCPVCENALGTARQERNYDNYYDDVVVFDADSANKKKCNSYTALKIGTVVFGFLVAIAVCVTVLCLV